MLRILLSVIFPTASCPNEGHRFPSQGARMKPVPKNHGLVFGSFVVVHLSKDVIDLLILLLGLPVGRFTWLYAVPGTTHGLLCQHPTFWTTLPVPEKVLNSGIEVCYITCQKIKKKALKLILLHCYICPIHSFFSSLNNLNGMEEIKKSENHRY